MDFDGARMRYLKAGTGPPLVLLHGLFGYSFSWRYTIPALAPYATVYVPDMLGAGFSDRPQIDHCMRATALRVLKFLERLGISSFNLLGTSRGRKSLFSPRPLDRTILRNLYWFRVFSLDC